MLRLNAIQQRAGSKDPALFFGLVPLHRRILEAISNSDHRVIEIFRQNVTKHYEADDPERIAAEVLPLCLSYFQDDRRVKSLVEEVFPDEIRSAVLGLREATRPSREEVERMRVTAEQLRPYVGGQTHAVFLRDEISKLNLSQFGEDFTPPAAGMEEVEAARDRVQSTLRRLLQAAPEFGQSAVVIGSSIYNQERMRFLPTLVEEALGRAPEQVLFDPAPDDPQKQDRRAEWIMPFVIRQALPGVFYLGDEDEFSDFSRFAKSAEMPKPSLEEAETDPVLFVLRMLESLGVPLGNLSAEQRQQLERDLGLLIQA